MKHRMGISPVLVEMVFVLLFFALSATVVMQLLGASVSISKESRYKSEALSVTTDVIEELLADPASLALGTATVQKSDYTVYATIQAEMKGSGTLYLVSCDTRKNGKSLLTLEGGRFVGGEEAS